MKYGIFLGRFSPFHIGHQHIIDKIKSDGLEPIAIVGSANTLNANTPYHAIERIHMLKLANPGIQAYALDDADCWDTWFDNLLSIIKLVVTPNLEEVVFYLHEKEEDLQSFIFRGKEFTNTSYCDVYRHEQLNIQQVPISDIPIRAKSIRANLEANKEYLHPKVYEYIKSKE